MKNYVYCGNDRSLKGCTALGRFVDGNFMIQVDEFVHPLSHGWHKASLNDWNEAAGVE